MGNRPDETYGGQAVIEGVMMRNRGGMCIAVRAPSGAIVSRREDYTQRRRARLWSWPVLRGVVALYDSVKLGIDALMWSAEAAGEADEQLTGWQVGLTVFLSLGIAVGLFMVLPTLLVSVLRGALGVGAGSQAGYARTVGLNIIEGLLRAGILVAYIATISRIPDIRRVLQYHGAEHRVIHASEAGEPLTAAAVRDYPILHPRCGTSFLLYVVLVSVVVFSFFGWPGVVQRLVIRLSLLPVVAGISYEWVRLAGRSDSRIVRLLCQPGLWLQRLTTKEPDAGQLEVALAALSGLRGQEAVRLATNEEVSA
jgi:uncharacterized protein YqhQ